MTGITAAISGINMGMSWRSDVDYVDFTKEFDTVENLDLENYSGSLYLREGNVSKVTVIAKSVPDTTIVEIKGDHTLTIENEDDVSWIFRILGNDYEEDSEVVILVPEGFIVNKAEFENHSGAMELTGFTASELRITGGSGNITGSDISAHRTKISTGSGRFKLEQVNLSNGSLDGGSGSISITDANLSDFVFSPGSGSLNVSGSLSGKNSIDGGSGSITFELFNSMESYDLDLDSGSGSIWINGEARNDNDYHGTAVENELDIDGGSGKVIINFAD